MTDKKTPKLVDDDSINKVEKLGNKVGAVYSGLGTDFRVVTRKARKAGEVYRRQWGEDMSVTEMVKSSASLMQSYTQSGGVRPFGCSVLYAGLDSNGDPRLYQVDPSGVYFCWNATAVGKGYVNAKSFLEKRYEPSMLLEDAIHTALLTMKEGVEGVLDKDNVEVGVVRKEKGVFEILGKDEVEDYLNEGN